MKKKSDRKRETIITETNVKSPSSKKKKQPKTTTQTHNVNHQPKPNQSNVLFSSANCLKKYKSMENISDCMHGRQGEKHKSKGNNGNNIENKTQRYEKVEPQENSKSTLRKGNYTERKDNEPVDHKRIQGKKIKNSRSISPKLKDKRKDNKSHQVRSPKKLNKSRLSVHIKKRKKMKVVYQNNFFLIGDNFVEVNENILQKFSEGLTNQSMLERNNNFSQIDNLFRRNERTQSSKINVNTNFDNLLQKRITEQPVIGENSIIKELPSISIEMKKEELNQIQKLVESPIKETHSEQKIDMCEDSLEMRANAANLQMKTRKQILERLHNSGKIDKKIFMQNLDTIMEGYDKELNEIQILRNLIDKNAKRVEELVNNTKKDIIVAEKIHEKSGPDILDQIFGQQIRKTNENSMNNMEVEEFYNNWNPSERKFYNNNFTQLVSNYKESQIIRSKIEERLSIQMGITDQKNQGIRTSVASVYLFLKNFFAFFIDKYAQEFLKYINMPYGYSPEQRLMYMQGYDDDSGEASQTNNITYGLEEVIRPEILQEFHQKYFENGENENQGCYEKIHNHLIFDCFNEALNFYRPYFYINGPPYMWTTSERALTFYYIAEENIDEVFDKTQIRVLKWAATLCGLMIEEAKVKEQIEYPNNLEDIICKYNKENHEILLEQRQSKIVKKEKIELEESSYEWNFLDEERTAVLYEVSSFLLEEFCLEACQIFINKC